MSTEQIYGHLSWRNPSTGEQDTYNGALPLMIGRSNKNDVPLPDSVVSAKHLRIEVVNGLVTMLDTSANGTFVNGKRIHKRVVTEATEFRIGPFICQFKFSKRDKSTLSRCSNELCNKLIDTAASLCPHCGTFVASGNTVISISSPVS